jgi:hypothetical protein
MVSLLLIIAAEAPLPSTAGCRRSHAPGPSAPLPAPHAACTTCTCPQRPTRCRHAAQVRQVIIYALDAAVALCDHTVNPGGRLMCVLDMTGQRSACVRVVQPLQHVSARFNVPCYAGQRPRLPPTTAVTACCKGVDFEKLCGGDWQCPREQGVPFVAELPFLCATGDPPRQCTCTPCLQPRPDQQV